MKNKNQRHHIKLSWISGKFLVLIYAFIVTVPLCYVILTAFKSEQERIFNPMGWPIDFFWKNFVIAIEKMNFLRSGWNSIFLSLSTTLLCMLLIIIVCYSLHCIRDTKIGNFMYLWILLAMIIPGVGTATGLMLRRSLGLYNNFLGEIIAGGFNLSMGVFMVSGAFRSLPNELFEAARIDGAKDTTICFRIITPIVKPSLVSMFILIFRTHWNACLGPMLTLRDRKLYTLPMSIYLNFMNGNTYYYSEMFAAVLITAIPVIILFIKCQDQFVDAMCGGVKG